MALLYICVDVLYIGGFYMLASAGHRVMDAHARARRQVKLSKEERTEQLRTRRIEIYSSSYPYKTVHGCLRVRV